ncbi:MULTISPECIES: hypothetical protein [unclassified Rickettsia]
MGSITHHWIQQGRKEEKIIMAKEMMKERLTLESVIKITKLSKAEIE